MPVKRRARYSHRLSDLDDALSTGETGRCGGELIGFMTLDWVSDVALLAAGGEPGHDGLVDDVAFQSLVAQWSWWSVLDGRAAGSARPRGRRRRGEWTVCRR